ncbi:hypothetical protein ABZ915_37280 [Streptomyces sp. NPDC046915]|uniref:hypothetical protein n=1 Tax=Streptomyces sp. NPDC046915 TaxID=3155257 RepID=UPI0033D34C85
MPTSKSDGSASATPQHLYTYSQVATQAVRNLQEWVRGPLANAIADYRATAVDFGGNIHGLTTGLDGNIDTEVIGRLTAVLDTDAGVRTTGKDFELADAHRSPLRNGWGPTPPTSYLTVSDADLDRAAAASGAALAKRVRQGLALQGDGFLANFNPFNVLLNVNDPVYTESFLRNLPQYDLVWLLAALGHRPEEPGKTDTSNTVVQFLLQLYGSDIDPKLRNAATSALFRRQIEAGYTENSYDDGSLAHALLVALQGAPPQTQVHFAQSLVSNPTQLRMYLAGIQHWGSDRAASQRLFLSVLTPALGAMSSVEARELGTLVGQNLPKLNTTEFTAILPQLTEFYSAAVARGIEPAPAGVDLSHWAGTEPGERTWALLEPFFKALRTADPDVRHVNMVIKSTLQNLYLGEVTQDMPKPSGELLQGLISTENLDPIKSLILDRLLKDQKGPDHLEVVGLNASLLAIGEKRLVTQLLLQRKIYRPGARHALELTGSDSDYWLLNDILRNPAQYKLGRSKDPNMSTVENLITQFEGRDKTGLLSLLEKVVKK